MRLYTQTAALLKHNIKLLYRDITSLLILCWSPIFLTLTIKLIFNFTFVSGRIVTTATLFLFLTLSLRKNTALLVQQRNRRFLPTCRLMGLGNLSYLIGTALSFTILGIVSILPSVLFNSWLFEDLSMTYWLITTAFLFSASFLCFPISIFLKNENLASELTSLLGFALTFM